MRLLALATLALSSAALAGCGPAASWLSPSSIGGGFVYRSNPLPEAQVRRDVPYRATGDPKHRLDLYLPLAQAQPAPVVVFVHGGGWTSGDKAFALGPHDLYGNVGRYFARRGVLAVVVNYRLLPNADWRGQTEDVAKAVAWTKKNAARYGGDPSHLVLMGHSAGAQLSARIALDPAWLAREGASARDVCGVVSVSGAAFDLTHVPSIKDDYRYFALRFAPPGFVPRRFMSSVSDPWQREASPALHARAGAPPFRLMVLKNEKPAFRQQAERLRAALVRVGAAVDPVEFYDGGPHSVGAILLSRADQGIARSALDFVRTTRCPNN